MSSQTAAPSPKPPEQPASPAVKRLREEVEIAKLNAERRQHEKALVEADKGIAEARVGGIKAVLPQTLDPGDLKADTVAVAGDEATGLARVLVYRASTALADDIADRVQKALNNVGKSSEVLIVGDETIFDEANSYRMVDAQIRRLELLVEEALPPAGGENHPVEPPEMARFMAWVPALAAAGQLLPSAINLIAKLRARAYHVSAQAISELSDLGFDLSVAGALRVRGTEATLVIDRFRVICESALMARIEGLVAATEGRSMATSLARAEQAAKLASEVADRTAARLTAAQARIAELLKAVPTTDAGEAGAAKSQRPQNDGTAARLRASLLYDKQALDGLPAAHPARSLLELQVDEATRALEHLDKELAEGSGQPDSAAEGTGESPLLHQLRMEREAEDRLAASLPVFRSKQAILERRVTDLVNLRKSVSEAVAALIVEGEKEPSLLARALRGEYIHGEKEDQAHLVLVVRLIAGGVDRVLETAVIAKDKRAVLAGAAAEYSLLTTNGAMLAGGTRSAFLSQVSGIGDPAGLEEAWPAYVSVPYTAERTNGETSDRAGDARGR